MEYISKTLLRTITLYVKPVEIIALAIKAFDYIAGRAITGKYSLYIPIPINIVPFCQVAFNIIQLWDFSYIKL